jgi:hypothetical protein
MLIATKRRRYVMRGRRLCAASATMTAFPLPSASRTRIITIETKSLTYARGTQNFTGAEIKPASAAKQCTRSSGLNAQGHRIGEFLVLVSWLG